MFSFLVACKSKTTEKKTEPNDAIPKIFDDYFDKRLQLFPFEATLAGINDYHDQFPIDISDTHREKIRLFYEKYKTALAKSDLSKLNDKDSISYQLLKWDIDTGLEGLNHTDHLLQLIK